MKKLFFLLISLLVRSVYGQEVLENNPPGLKWYQVNTPNFRVLFPKGFDDQALRVANTLEHIHKVEAGSLGSVPKKIPVILQNQSSESNGFVSMLPRRSEFYTMPSQNYNFSGTNDWLDLLAAHEYRHVVQYQHATRGFNRLVYYLFGTPTLAAMAQAAAPDWFWEGDAVIAETAFTPSGRGKIPNFGLVFRTNLMEGRTFNYHKQYLRSYKHNIPNHYVLGYYMTSYLRRRMNDRDVWGKITARSWSVPFLPFAFSNAIKKESGLYVTDLYNEMARDLKKEWQAEIDKLQLTDFETVNKRTGNTYTDYLYPQPQPDGSILVMKKGIGDIEKFVSLQSGKEKRVFTPGFINEAGMLSSRNGMVVWNEFGYDPRWPVRNYSLIKAYDLKKRKKYVVSEKKSRYASASVSSDGGKIVTVKTDKNYKHSLVVLAFPKGNVLKEYPNPENYFYSMPRFSDDGRIVALKLTKDGKTISLFNTATDESEDILPVSNENVGHPILVDDYLLFNSPISGIDNIYGIDLKTKQRYQITSSKYGAYNPAVSPDRKAIYYNEQTKNGFDVVKIPFDTTLWKPFQERKEINTFYQHLIEQEGRPNVLDSVPQKKYPVTRYSKIKGLINPFSWGAFIEDDLTRANVGITSRDILSTTNVTAGYTFDINERTGFWRAGVSYQGWLPIIDFNYRFGNRSVDEGSGYSLTEWFITRQKDTTEVVTDQSITFKWTEQNMEGGLRIPFNLTHSKYFTNLSIADNIGLTEVSKFRSKVNGSESGNSRFIPRFIQYDTIIRSGQPVPRTITASYQFLDYTGNARLIYNHFSASGFRLLKTNRRDIYSKWGQAFFMDYYRTYSGDLSGGLFSIIGYLYFPGLAKHHSLNGYVAYQETQYASSAEDAYLFRNNVPAPRGLSFSRFKKFYSASANYTLPLWYPDIAAGPVLNLQRVRANLFFDYAYGNFRLFRGDNDFYASVGAEIKFDINILRFLPQIDIGFRYSYGLRPSVTDFEFLVGTFNF